VRERSRAKGEREHLNPQQVREISSLRLSLPSQIRGLSSLCLHASIALVWETSKRILYTGSLFLSRFPAREHRYGFLRLAVINMNAGLKGDLEAAPARSSVNYERECYIAYWSAELSA